MNLRMATSQLASIGAPPRARRVHQPRLRLQVQSFPEAARAVKIRHASQNLGSPVGETTVVSEILPAQIQPA